jgi:hypothetical protein
MSLATDKLLKFANENELGLKLEKIKFAMQECEDLFTQLALNSVGESGVISHENAAIVRAFRDYAKIVNRTVEEISKQE